MLNPLTEIVIGVLMAIGISSSQFVMDILSNRERRESEQNADNAKRHSESEKSPCMLSNHRWNHQGGLNAVCKHLINKAIIPPCQHRVDFIEVLR